MTTEAPESTALTTSNVDPEVAQAMQMFGRLRPLKDALGIDTLTDGEMQLFAMVALHTGLDPFTRQIYAIKRGGKVTHQTGIDGYRSSAERTGQYAGSDEADYEACACGGKGISDPADPKDLSPVEHPAVARVTVHRMLPNGHVVNQVGVARWHELKPDHTKPQGAYTFLDQMWWDMPYNQLAKCAEANALRKAFPRVLAGVYITDEMQQANVIDGEATEVAAPPPAVRDRIAARRAAAEAAMAPVSASPEAAAGTPVGSDGPTAAVAVCGDEDASPLMNGICAEPPGHKGFHKSAAGDTWPR